jgi:CBS domain-containing protein
MRDNNEGVVLVVAAEDGCCGICTERDLAFKVLAAGLDATSTPVGSVMTANPQTIHPEKPSATRCT